jgi:uncharacterized protein YebE (UPF0316 family)
MDAGLLQDPQFFSLVVLPVLIFVSRVADVTFGTLRIIYVSRGMKFLAPVVAFFEILIWLAAIGQIFQNLSSITNYIAYAAGFAVGNYVGILVEERMAMGLMLIRIITQYDAQTLIAHLKRHDYGVTAVDATGKHGPVKLIFLVVQRKDINRVIAMVQEFNPHAFYTIADVRSVRGGNFPPPPPRIRPRRGPFRFYRKGK